MGTYGRFPVEFVRGRGTELFDSEGRRYLDFLSGLAVTSLGHAHPAVAAAISEQASTLLHVSNLFHTEHQAPVAADARRPARRRRPLLLRQLRCRGQRVRDQARPALRPAARRPRALPRDLRVRLVPRPHARHARRDRSAAEAGDVRAAAVGLPPGRVRRSRRARGRDGRPRLRGAARGGAGRGRCAAGAGRLPAGGAPPVRRARSAVDRRRGADRSRPHRSLVRVRARRRGARHRHHGQGARQRHADRCLLGRAEVAAAFRPGDHATTFGGQPLAASAALPCSPRCRPSTPRLARAPGRG